MGLALAALRRLGEDIETSLYQLAFGTVEAEFAQANAKGTA